MFGARQNCGKKIGGIGGAFDGRGRYVDAVAAIVLGGCADISAADAVTGPDAGDGRGFMDKDSSDGW